MMTVASRQRANPHPPTPTPAPGWKEEDGSRAHTEDQEKKEEEEEEEEEEEDAATAASAAAPERDFKTCLCVPSVGGLTDVWDRNWAYVRERENKSEKIGEHSVVCGLESTISNDILHISPPPFLVLQKHLPRPSVIQPA